MNSTTNSAARNFIFAGTPEVFLTTITSMAVSATPSIGAIEVRMGDEVQRPTRPGAVVFPSTMHLRDPEKTCVLLRSQGDTPKTGCRLIAYALPEGKSSVVGTRIPQDTFDDWQTMYEWAKDTLTAAGYVLPEGQQSSQVNTRKSTGRPLSECNEWAITQFEEGKFPGDIVREYEARYEQEDNTRATPAQKALSDLHSRWKKRTYKG